VCTILNTQLLSNLLSPNPKSGNTGTSAFFTGCGKIVLSFTNMTKSHHFAVLLFVIGNGNRTFFTLRNVTAIVANHTLGVAFLIHEHSDFFPLLEIFGNPIHREFGKIMIQLFGHIHEEDVFVGMFEMFVVHYFFIIFSIVF
jgi:hypothetical protein